MIHGRIDSQIHGWEYKVDPSAFTIEGITDTTKTSGDPTTRYLRIDDSKVSASVRGAVYYSTARIKGNSESAIVQNAYHLVKHDLMSTTKDYGPVYAFGLPGRGNIIGSDGGVVFLHNAKKEIVGYSIIEGGRIKVTETLLGMDG